MMVPLSHVQGQAGPSCRSPDEGDGRCAETMGNAGNAGNVRHGHVDYKV